MTEFAYAVMLGFMLLSPLLFFYFTAERALVVLFIVSLMWLPQISFEVPFFGGLSHSNIPTICALLGMVISGATSQSSLSLTKLDLPILLAPICPFITSLTNGLGPYDGVVAGTNYLLAHTAAFLLGRAFLATPDGRPTLNFLARRSWKTPVAWCFTTLARCAGTTTR